MSGHSHWATTRRQKEVKDAKKGQIFTKLARNITMAAHHGGNPDDNPSLRLAIDKAREMSMPMDNIKRAIDRGTGTGEARLEEVNYEGYGPGGVAFLVKCVTDNKNRTVSEIRNIFSKSGGNMGEAGSAAYVFGGDPENPQFTIPVDEETYAKVEKLADNLEDNDDVQVVYTNVE
ncbi:MAG: YebC/PmpR family DNA-binding transcriptional regulator [candidate division WWE3 bacterium]|nr:YebC/PmpR family DNA-binding transcriptional regulator [candidate division WWE3 bacterium]